MQGEPRILHIISGRGCARSAAYASVVISGLATAGITQALVVDDLPTPAPAGIRIFSLSRVFAKSFLHFAIRRFSPNLIQCWTRRAALLTPSSRKIPVVGWLSGPEDPAYYRSCSHLVAATEAIADYCGRRGTERKRLRVIPFFCADAAARPADRAAMATPQTAPVLASFLRLHPDKGADVLMQAMMELDDAYLWLGGEGPLRRLLDSEASLLGVAARIRFAEPAMDQTALLRAANLAVLPAARETSDAAIAEAWAAGVPVVACKNAVSSSLIEDGVDGLLVPPGDAAALAAAIRRVLGDEGLRRRLIAEGYAAYVKSFAREAVVRRWTGFYNELLAV